MRTYVLRRLVLAVVSVAGVSVLVFAMMRVLPGDIAVTILTGGGGDASGYSEIDLDRLRRELRLDDPLHVQYLTWLFEAARGDLGRSLLTGQPIANEILQRLAVTSELALLALAIGVAVAIPSAVVSAVRRNTLADQGLRVFSALGLSVPTFWMGMILILVSLFLFRAVPRMGYVSLWQDPGENVRQFIWPALPLAFHLSAVLTRMGRSALLDVLHQDYVRTAQAKGLGERSVIFRHALRNALLPIVTVLGFQIAGLMSGSVVIEIVFSLPGIGSYLVDAIRHRDYPVVQGVVMTFTMILILSNLLVDIAYAWIDPRIRFE